MTTSVSDSSRCLETDSIGEEVGQAGDTAQARLTSSSEGDHRRGRSISQATG